MDEATRRSLDDVRAATAAAERRIKDRDECMAAAYRAGASIRDIRGACGLSVEGVRQTLIRRGVPMRERGSGRVLTTRRVIGRPQA